MRAALILMACLVAVGCWNGENVQVRLGDVSIGRQLIDLKAALDQGAMTKAEYDRVRILLLSLGQVCENTSGQPD